jgi:hypothetical protein
MRNVETASFLYGLCTGLTVGLVALLVVLWWIVRLKHQGRL